jgi:hypothetical protein
LVATLGSVAVGRAAFAILTSRSAAAQALRGWQQLAHDQRIARGERVMAAVVESGAIG